MFKMMQIIVLCLFVIGGLCEFQSPLRGDIEVPKIAVIGAGAGGSSVSYHLQNFTSGGYNITVFEKNLYVGGRSTTIANYDNSSFDNWDIELGASVFVKANKILFNAVERYNLSTQSFDLSEKYPDYFHGSVGIWNGSQFVFSSSGDESSVGGLFKIVWKYGLAPIKTWRLVKSVVAKFVQGFYRDNFPFQLDSIVLELGFDELTGVTGDVYLKDTKGISELFIKDIIEAATRVNYASDIDDIHALESIVSLAAEDTVQVVGGNYKIFEEFIKESGATLLLNTSVHKISEPGNGCKWVVESDIGIDEFDQVIVAAPMNQTGISIETGDDLVSQLEEVEYRELHVSYISTPRTKKMDNNYFHCEDSVVPEMILTRSSTNRETKLPFYSINIVSYDEISDMITYKIFSPKEVDKEFLSLYLFNDLDDVEISFKKLWFPYPLLRTTTNFNKFQITRGLWYLNSIERFISTMETSALAGASVAGLISLEMGKNTSEVSLPYI